MPHKDPEAHRAYHAAYREKNKELLRQKAKARQAAHPEVSRAYNARRDKRQHCERSRKWHHKNRDRILARKRAAYDPAKSRLSREHYYADPAKRQLHCDYQKRWRHANPDKYRAGQHAARARRRGAKTGDRRLHADFIKKMKAAKRMRCHWCRLWLKPADRTVDHIVPLAKKGPDSVHNLCCSCRSCNSRKNVKLPHEFTGQFELIFETNA